jgi:hypothetical protein
MVKEEPNTDNQSGYYQDSGNPLAPRTDPTQYRQFDFVLAKWQENWSTARRNYVAKKVKNIPCTYTGYRQYAE